MVKNLKDYEQRVEILDLDFLEWRRKIWDLLTTFSIASMQPYPNPALPKIALPKIALPFYMRSIKQYKF